MRMKEKKITKRQLERRRKEIRTRWIGYFIFFILGVLYGWVHYWIEAIVIWGMILLVIRISDDYTGRYEK